MMVRKGKEKMQRREGITAIMGTDSRIYHTCKYVACTDPSVAAVTMTGHDSEIQSR